MSFISWNWGFNLHWTFHEFDLTHTNKLKLLFNLFDQCLQTMHDIFLKSGTYTFYTIALKNIAEFLSTETTLQKIFRISMYILYVEENKIAVKLFLKITFP